MSKKISNVKKGKYAATGILLSLMFTFLNFNLQCSGSNTVTTTPVETDIKSNSHNLDIGIATSSGNPYQGKYYPIYITIDLHLDPMPEHDYPENYTPGDGANLNLPDATKLLELISDKANVMDQRLQSVEYAVSNILNRANITFFVSGEFMEFCLEENFNTVKNDLQSFVTAQSFPPGHPFSAEVLSLSTTDFDFYNRCAEVIPLLYESGGSIGSHSHNGIYTDGQPFSWQQLSSNVDAVDPVVAAQISDIWEASNDWVSAGVLEFIENISEEDLPDIINARGSHLPDNTPDASEADTELYHQLMEDYNLSFVEAGPEEIFYEYFDHYVMNPYRPHLASWLQEDTSSNFVLIPSAPVIGKNYTHFGVLQDLRLNKMKTLFLQVYGNWRDEIINHERPTIYTLGFAFHAKDLVHYVLNPTDDTSEAYQIVTAVDGLLDWLDENFIGRTDFDNSFHEMHADPVATYVGRKYIHDVFVDEWEPLYGGSPSSFSYPNDEYNKDNYPYLHNLQEHLKYAHFVKIITNESEHWIAYEFEDQFDGKTIYMIWTIHNMDGLAIDFSPEGATSELQFSSPIISVVDGTGSIDKMPATTIPIGKTPIILFSD